jgi:hypothetical protein
MVEPTMENLNQILIIRLAPRVCVWIMREKTNCWPIASSTRLGGIEAPDYEV